MPSAINQSVRSSRVDNRHSRGFIARQWTLLSVLLVIGAALLAINIGSQNTSASRRTGSRTGVGANSAGLKQDNKFLAGVLSRHSGISPGIDGSFDVSDYLMTPGANFSAISPGAAVSSFDTAQDFATRMGPRSVVAGDLNGDGRPDLVSANRSDDTLSVLFNTTAPGAASPTFAPEQGFAVGAAPQFVTLGDLNHSGTLDVAVANGDDNTVSVLLNNTLPGNLTPSLASPQTFAAGANPTCVLMGDLNGDGNLDLAVTNAVDNTVSVLLNTTAPGAFLPTFASQQTFATGLGPASMSLGDLNGDGKLDLMTANRENGNVSVLLNTTAPGDVTLTFTTAENFAAGLTPRSITMGDLNGDGQLDLAITNLGSDVVSVLLNTTAPGALTPTFAGAQNILASDSPVGITIGDVNGDGRLDLAVTNIFANVVSVVLNTTAPGSSAFSVTAPQVYTTGNDPLSALLSDLNGDGNLDLIVANSISNTLTVLLNTFDPDPATPSLTAPQDFMSGSLPYSATAGDLNGDGRRDLVVANQPTASVSVLLNTTAPGSATPSFAILESFATGPNPFTVTVGDLNGDGRPDLITASLTSHTVSVLINTTVPGAAIPSFAAQQSFACGSNPVWVAAGDLNGDGSLDLVVANAFSNMLSVLLNTTAPGSPVPTFASAQSFATGDGPVSIAVSDLNGDGKLDLSATNRNDATVSVLLNTTAPGDTIPTFASAENFATDLEPSAIAAGDLNGDGKPDLVTANNDPHTVSVLLNTTAPGATTPSFASAQNFATDALPSSVMLGDLNGDGKLDLAVANTNSNSVSVLCNTTAPGATALSFAATRDFVMNGFPSSVVLGDINGDGKLDLAVANTDPDSISVLLNTPAIVANPGLSREQGVAATNSLIAAVIDYGGDGNVIVTVNSANPSNGMTISNIVNTLGNITADIAADCPATDATFTLQATDGSSTVTVILAVSVTVVTPTISPSGPTTFCAGGSVTLTSSSASGNQWYLNGNPIGGETNQTYIATASGDYTTTVTSGACGSVSSLATTVTVTPAPATPTITPDGPTTFCAGGSVTLTSSSATGNQWYLNGNPIGGATNQTYVATASGNYTDIVTAGGCPSAPSSATTVTVNPTPATPTITPDGPTTFCAGGSVTLTSSSASGNQWYLDGNPIGGATNQTYVATASGNYTDIVTASGCPSAPSAATTVTVNPTPATPTITPGGPTTFCAGGSVTLTSSSATGNQWYLNGNPIGGATNQTYVATASGNYTDIVTASGCSSAPSAATTVTVNPIPTTPTITPDGPTTFCAGGSVTLTSSSASGNQWYLDGNPIGGATNQTYVATAAGDYTAIVTTSGCSSAPSAATTVTINASSPVVTNTNDGGVGSLRQAIIDACDGAIITFDPGLSGQTITLTSGELAINKNLTIQGLGANLLTVSRINNISAPSFRIFLVNAGMTVTISGLTISNGRTTDGANNGSSGDYGGGIRNNGNLTVTNSTISNNRTGNGGSGGFGGQGGFGGGVYNEVGSNLDIVNSTVSGNLTGAGGIGNTDNGGFGGSGGGIHNAGTLALTNCTVSGNQTGNGNSGPINGGNGGSGGGVFNFGTFIVTNSTVASNQTGNGGAGGFAGSSGFGGGVYHGGDLASIQNTLFGDNSVASGAQGPDLFGAFNSQDFNLIEDTMGASFTGSTTNNVTGQDPRLSPLANNGGPTQTHALLAGSPALDAADNTTTTNAGLTTDQRGVGFARILDAADVDTVQTVDIGAFEAQASVEDITDKSTPEDAPLSFDFNVGDTSAITSVTATSSNTTLVPNLPGNLSVTGTGSTRTLSSTPAPNQTGTSIITVTVTSGAESVSDTFVLTVTGVNDAPTFQIVSNPPTINEDDPAQTVISFATNFQPGPPTALDEAGQTLVGYTVSITGSTGNPSFTSGPIIDNAGTLTYTMSANAFGTITFNAVATDSGSGTPPNVNQSMPVAFTIAVNAVNDPPVNGVPGPQSVVENSTLTISTASSNAISISDEDAGSDPVQVTLTASNGSITLSSLSGLIFTVGNGSDDAVMTFTGSIANINTALNGLVFTPTPGFDGAASIQIITNDQGSTGSGGASSDTDTVTINVLDGGTLAFSSTTYAVSESGPVATITVNRSGGTNGEARIDCATSDGTATGGGTDYTTATGTLIFANGVATQTFTVPINNDTLDEPNETVNLTLSNPQGSGAAGSPSTAVLTITDNEAAPAISIDDPSVTEGNSGTVNLVFTVTLSNPSGQTVTVNYATGNNTAVAPGDFVAIPSTLLTFNPLETTKQITVLVNGDSDFEPNEALELNLSSPSNATLPDPQGLGFIVDDDASGGTLAFSSSTFTVNEDAGSATITVNRTGTTTQAVTVDYATLDISASERSDYTTALGTLNFAAGATSATFTVLVNVDSFAEGAELVLLSLSNPSSGVALGVPQTAVLQIDNVASAPPNTIDDAGAFVDQQYHDFLNRVPDPAGRAFWIDQITSCGSDATCVEIRRINVSAAFFLSIEFQETGVTAFLTHQAAFGTALPGYRPFERDTQALQRGFAFGLPGADVVLEANKVAFFNAFVLRPEFTAIYGSLTNDQYVDALIANTGVVFTAPERDALVNGLNATTETRATVLRKITEKGSFKQAQFNRAFVYMQYIGYLRRNPADPPDNNLDGFNFWLNKLNQFNGNFVDAEMVKAFIISGEYRQRFGP